MTVAFFFAIAVLFVLVIVLVYQVDALRARVRSLELPDEDYHQRWTLNDPHGWTWNDNAQQLERR